MGSSRPPVQSAVFVSHGSPMTALEKGAYAGALARFGASHAPKAIVIISAHWQNPEANIGITAGAHPELLYDFGGFPRELYELEYGAPGSPALAQEIATDLKKAGFSATLDPQRGWDHGVWVPLRLMFPEGRIPVVEISLPMFPPHELYEVGQVLSGLRAKGTLIMGSGGIVHNLRLMNWRDQKAPPESWAREFQNWVREQVAERRLVDLFDYENRAPYASRAVPTPEHFAPLFPVLGAAGEFQELQAIYDGIEHGNMSMFTFALV
jgi:4,5-DOPA dioxygenase extradiol